MNDTLKHLLIVVVLLVLLAVYMYPLVRLNQRFAETSGLDLHSDRLQNFCSALAENRLDFRTALKLFSGFIATGGLGLLFLQRQKMKGSAIFASIAIFALVVGAIGLALYSYFNLAEVQTDFFLGYGPEAAAACLDLTTSRFQELLTVLGSLLGLSAASQVVKKT